MTHHTLLQHRLFCFASLIIFTLSFTSLVYAQRQRNYVSMQRGDDANMVIGCPITFPCRSFNAAINVVYLGGEVVAMDSGGYGPITISKAVTLTAPPGVYVGVTAMTPGSSAIRVSAPSTDTVVVRGLTLTGSGGSYGIYTSSVGNLHVEGCVISGFDANGIFVDLTADGSHIFVKDTITRNNLGNGIEIRTTTGTVKASIDNCRSERNGGYGFLAYYNSRVTINRSVASGNGAGFVSTSNSVRETAEMTCEECVASNNAEGFMVAGAGGVASIHVSHSTATNNNYAGFVQSGTGVFESLGNNLVRRNTFADILGTITVITGQ